VIVEEKFLHRVDSAIDMGVLALAEPLAVAARGVSSAADLVNSTLDGQRVLVLGGGMIGMACVAVLRFLYGCESVTLFDPIPSRSSRARLFGANSLAQSDVPEGVPLKNYADLNHRNGYDMVFETTGSHAAFTQSLEQVNPGGTIVHFGFLEEAMFAPKVLAIKGIRMFGTIGGSGMFQAILPVLIERADLLRCLITNTFAARDVEAAFASASNREASLKTQMVFNATNG
jgi:threonine dehydrogenase-like Zn-dependent dehydrogenase